MKIIFFFCFFKLFLTSLHQNDPNKHTKINSKQFFLKKLQNMVFTSKTNGPLTWVELETFRLYYLFSSSFKLNCIKIISA